MIILKRIRNEYVKAGLNNNIESQGHIRERDHERVSRVQFGQGRIGDGNVQLAA